MQKFWQNQTLPNLQEITAAQHIVFATVAEEDLLQWQMKERYTFKKLCKKKKENGGKSCTGKPRGSGNQGGLSPWNFEIVTPVNSFRSINTTPEKRTLGHTKAIVILKKLIYGCVFERGEGRLF